MILCEDKYDVSPRLRDGPRPSPVPCLVLAFVPLDLLAISPFFPVRFSVVLLLFCGYFSFSYIRPRSRWSVKYRRNREKPGKAAGASGFLAAAKDGEGAAETSNALRKQAQK